MIDNSERDLRVYGASAGNSRPRALVTRPIQPKAIEHLAQRCEVLVHPEDEPMPLDRLISGMQDVVALLPSGVRIEERAIAGATKLRVIANIGVGYDNIDLDACTRRKILVTNTPDVLTETTADLAFALILSTARRIVEGDRFVRENRWKRWEWNCLWGADVHGKTLGLYGFGRIGQATARRGRGFSMRILYHARHRVSERIERELNAEFVDRETLLRESDFVSIHAPSTPETRHAIDSTQLALLKPSAVLVNTARGNLVNEQALIHALQAGQLAGAGLDVFEFEPKVSPELLAMKNVVLLPHIGSATEETRSKMAFLAIDNVLATLDGKRPQNLVNPEAFR